MISLVATISMIFLRINLS